MHANPYLEALRRVEAGHTASFADLARLAGRPAAARAAGRAVAAAPLDDPRPWHRVVRSDGGLSPDPRRAAIQLERLRAEGARPRDGEHVAAWIRRRRARYVGSWPSRRFFDALDARLVSLDPRRVEALRDADTGFERGFRLAPAPPEPRGAGGLPRRADGPPRRADGPPRRADALPLCGSAPRRASPRVAREHSAERARRGQSRPE